MAKRRRIKLRLDTQYLTREGVLEVLAAEQLPDGRTKLWLRLTRKGGETVKEIRYLTTEDLERIAEENRRARGDES